MITLPLFILLSIYAVVVLVCIILWCINVYHIISSASMTVVAFFFSFGIGFLGLTVVGITWIMLGDIAWDDRIPLVNPGEFVSHELP